MSLKRLKECGFGYGQDARCVGCRSARFKEDGGVQNYYKKTRLSGFQDMECIPCGDPPPPYEPHCSGRVNLVPLPSVATSPRDMALAAVICSALATVLLALLVLCVIYCKRQLLEKKPGGELRTTPHTKHGRHGGEPSMRLQDGPHGGAELSCLDRRWLHDFPDGPCCQCHLGPGHTCGPVHLIPSLCWDDSCSLGRDSWGHSAFHSQMSLSNGTPTQDQDQDPDQGGAQSHTGSEPRPESASAESWSAVRSERSLVAPCSPDLALRGEPSGDTAQEEEVEEEEEEVEEQEQEGSGSGEDVQRRMTWLPLAGVPPLKHPGLDTTAAARSPFTSRLPGVSHRDCTNPAPRSRAATAVTLPLPEPPPLSAATTSRHPPGAPIQRSPDGDMYIHKYANATL
ncbi:hypothetical protein CRUP_019684 [Coryphaenoides rupestris]|nr:hypothetical protein CRUP_019684 [Coryphaenoides rupestris]